MKYTKNFNFSEFIKQNKKKKKYNQKQNINEYLNNFENNPYKKTIENILNPRINGATIYIPLINFINKKLKEEKQFDKKFLIYFYDTFIVEFNKYIKNTKEKEVNEYENIRNNLKQKQKNLLMTFQKFHILLKNMYQVSVKYENMEKVVVTPEILKEIFKGFNEQSYIIKKTKLQKQMTHILNDPIIKKTLEEFAKNPVFEKNEKIIPNMLKSFAKTQQEAKDMAIHEEYSPKVLEEKAPTQNFHPIGPSLGI